MKNFEVKQISEKEIWIGINKILLIEENIIYVTAIGEQTTELAISYVESFLSLTSKLHGGIKYLIDLNKCGKNSPEARLIWEKIGGQKDTIKVALFGLNPVARVIASFVTGRISQNNKMLFFNTKEQAMNWLME